MAKYVRMLDQKGAIPTLSNETKLKNVGKSDSNLCTTLANIIFVLLDLIVTLTRSKT